MIPAAVEILIMFLVIWIIVGMCILFPRLIYLVWKDMDKNM